MLEYRNKDHIIHRRHPEWREHHLRWRWLLDSLEGGERYRQAIYGYDRRGQPIRNMVRHKREYPDPRESHAGGMDYLGSHACGSGYHATDDDYELRRTRTPIPTFLAEAIDTHLSRIYSREVKRVGPEQMMQWFSDVDGCGTPIGDWMSRTVAPLLLALGQLDLYMDHPPAPEGETIRTRADLLRLGLDRCIATYILPENLLWWKLDQTGRRYVECLVQEPHETDQGIEVRYRHWTSSAWTLYNSDGETIAGSPHPFGRVPIVRVFDSRKPRCRNIGQSRYEGVAERQKEYYNRDSELILSDTTQAHPLLQGPEDFMQADGTIPVGPSWLLPKKKNTQGGTATYEGFDVVSFPKDGAASIRRNKMDLRDDVDRDSALVKPTGRGSVVQSGLAKAIDHHDGNNRLAKIARMLASTERIVAELALTILSDGLLTDAQAESIEIIYPTEFDLFTANDLASATAEFQSLVTQAGALPRTEGLMLCRLMRLCLPGLSDVQYAECDSEIKNYLNINKK